MKTILNNLFMKKLFMACLLTASVAVANAQTWSVAGKATSTLPDYKVTDVQTTLTYSDGLDYPYTLTYPFGENNIESLRFKVNADNQLVFKNGAEANDSTENNTEIITEKKMIEGLFNDNDRYYLWTFDALNPSHNSSFSLDDTTGKLKFVMTGTRNVSDGDADIDPAVYSFVWNVADEVKEDVKTECVGKLVYDGTTVTDARATIAKNSDGSYNITLPTSYVKKTYTIGRMTINNVVATGTGDNLTFTDGQYNVTFEGGTYSSWVTASTKSVKGSLKKNALSLEASVDAKMASWGTDLSFELTFTPNESPEHNEWSSEGKASCNLSYYNYDTDDYDKKEFVANDAKTELIYAEDTKLFTLKNLFGGDATLKELQFIVNADNQLEFVGGTDISDDYAQGRSFNNVFADGDTWVFYTEVNSSDQFSLFHVADGKGTLSFPVYGFDAAENEYSGTYYFEWDASSMPNFGGETKESTDYTGVLQYDTKNDPDGIVTLVKNSDGTYGMSIKNIRLRNGIYQLGDMIIDKVQATEDASATTFFADENTTLAFTGDSNVSTSLKSLEGSLKDGVLTLSISIEAVSEAGANLDFVIFFSPNGETAVNSAHVDNIWLTTDKIYDLLGRSVRKVEKNHVYIVGGHKVIGK